MNIGFYGGSFDPFHKGHQKILQAALAAHDLDKVIVMPAGSPPHKKDKRRGFAAYRLRMAELALETLSKAEVSSWEIEKESASYTVESLTYLRTLYGDDTSLFLIMGQDMFMTLDQWHRFEDILKQSTIMVARRPGGSEEAYLAQLKRLKQDYGAAIIEFDMEPMDISATEVREAVSNNGSWEGDVSPEVREFILANQLYVTDEIMDSVSAETLEKINHYERRLLKLLSLPRLVHVLNVMRTAVELAVRFGADPDAAAVAGLLHDTVKEKPLAEQRRMAAPMDPQEVIADAIIHGPAATSYLEEVFDVHDPEILRAVSNHSILSAEPHLLEQIIYLADKIEPSREYDDLPAIREAAQADLEEAVILTIKGQEMNLHGKGSELLPETLEGRAFLEGIVRQGKSHKARE